MPFEKTPAPVADDDLLLTDLLDVGEDKQPREVAEAVFADGSRLAFPAGCRFTPDNHEDVQLRLRVWPPKDSKARPVLLPQHCTKRYVRDVIALVSKG